MPNQKKEKTMNKMSRRGFLKMTASTLVAPTVCTFVSIKELLAASGSAIDLKNLGPLPKGVDLTISACDMCGAQCPTFLSVVNGKVKGTYGNAAARYTGHGRICGKAHAGLEKAYHPERITQPMMRRGPNHYEPVSWKEAIDFMADRLVRIADKYGENAVHVYRGTSTHDKVWKNFWKTTYGSLNVFGNDSVCDAGRRTAGALTMGDSRPMPDLAHTRVGVVFGVDYLASTKYIWYPVEMMAALNAGAKFYVVDPRFSETAARAVAHGGVWVPIKPGTDAALAMAMAHLVFSDPKENAQRMNSDIVRWSEDLGWHDGPDGFGVDRYAESLKDKTPEWAADITGIPADLIRTMTTDLLSSDAPLVDAWTGLSHRQNGFYAVRAAFCLAGLVNAVDRKGGLVRRNGFKLGNAGVKPIPNPSPGYRSKGPKGQFVRACGMYRFVRSDCNALVPNAMMDPDFATAEYKRRRGKDPSVVEPYPIKAFITSTRNFANGNAGSPLWREAMTKLLDDPDGLIVDVNLFISEQGAFAHLVLPETSYLEREDIYSPSSLYPTVHIRKAAIPPQGKSKTLFDMTALLIDALAERGYKGGDYSSKTLLSTHDDTATPYASYMDVMRERVISKHGEDFWQGLQNTGVWEAKDTSPAYGKKGFGWSKLGKFTKTFDFYNATLAGEQPPEEKLHAHVHKPGKAQKAYKRFDLPPLGTFQPLPVQETPYYARPQKAFPLHLVGCGRNQWNSASKTTHLRSSMEREPENFLTIHPQDAKKLGIYDRDRVKISNPAGKQIFSRAKVTEGIRPGVVQMPNGFGQNNTTESIARRRGANVNELMDAKNIDPITGAEGLAEMIVKVEIA